MRSQLMKVCIQVLILLTAVSCTYPGYDFIDGSEDSVVIIPADGRYVEATLDDVVIPGLDFEAFDDITAVFTSTVGFFTDFFGVDGILSMIADEVGVPVPDIVIRPRSISASLSVDARDEVIMLGSRYADYSSVRLSELKLDASGNVSNLMALILHSIDSHEWPENEAVTGKLDLNMLLRLEKGEDAGASVMPLAMLSANVKIELENVKFSSLVVNGVSVPLPKSGKLRISGVDASFASSHLSVSLDDGEFPSLDGSRGSRRIYRPYSVSFRIEPTLLFDASKAFNAVKGMVQHPESQDAYWSLFTRIVWGRFSGDHVSLTTRIYEGEDIPPTEDVYRDLMILQIATM